MLQNRLAKSEYYCCFHTDLHNITDSLISNDNQVIIFVERGSAMLKINGRDYCLKEHMMLFLVPNSEIKLMTSSADFQVFFLSFLRSILHEVSQRMEPRFFGLLFHRVQWNIFPKARACVQGFCSMFEFAHIHNRNPYRYDIIKSLIGIFIKGLYGIILEYYPELKSDESLRVQNLFKRFMMSLDMNYTTQHSVQFYAESLCISSKYLTQICHKIVGKTPKTLIDYTLFTASLSLLEQTDKTVQEVSHDLGFPDQSYFSRFFKRCIGVSPVYYRQHPGQVHIPVFDEF